MNEQLSAPQTSADDATNDSALRPNSLSEFVGQQRVKDQLGLVLHAAKGRGASADHVLFAGPPGLGKTTLAMIMASEMQAPLRITSGPSIQHAGDLASILSSLQSGEVLFIDEIHRVARSAQELLYLAMEDFRVDVMVGKGPGATSIPIDLPPFTLAGATTRAGLLPAPLRDRFGFTAQLDFYDSADLEQIIARSAAKLDIAISPAASAELARRSRGTPRIANRLLRRARDFNQVHSTGEVDLATSIAALNLYEVDDSGLDRLDRSVLLCLIDKFGGGPAGLSTLAITVGEEAETIETVCEPFLVRQGLLTRTTRGRVATPAAYALFGRSFPPNQGLFE